MGIEEIDSKLEQIGLKNTIHRQRTKEILLFLFVTRHINKGSGPCGADFFRYIAFKDKEEEEILEILERLKLIRKNRDFSYNLTKEGIKPEFSGIELAKINFQNYIQKNYDKLRSITKEIPKLLFHILCYHYHFPSSSDGLIHHARYEIHPKIYRHFDHEQFVNFPIS
ncbi:MAG: hypothetical protein ACTSYB_11275 [Candidatus Helarchaeota archaeon]